MRATSIGGTDASVTFFKIDINRASFTTKPDLRGLVTYIHGNPVDAKLVDNIEQLGHFPWCSYGALVGSLLPRSFENPSLTLQLFAADPVEVRRRLQSRLGASSQHMGPIPPKSVGAPAKEILPRLEVSTLDQLIDAICEEYSLPRVALGSGRRSQSVVAARATLSQRAICELGFTTRSVAQALGVSDSTISRALSLANSSKAEKK